MDPLSILLFNYLTILAINSALAVFCLVYYREAIYRTVLFVWLGSFLNLMLQGIFQTGVLEMSLAFSGGIVLVLLQQRLLHQAQGIRFPTRTYGVVWVLAVVSSVIASFYTQSFTWVALPIGIVVSGVNLHGAILAIRRSSSSSDRAGIVIFCLILVAQALHDLDYAFLRTNESFAVFGFSIALVLLVASSIFVPSFIVKAISDAYVQKLAELNAKQIEAQRQLGDLVSMAQVGEASFGFVHDMASPITLLNLYSAELAQLQVKGIPSKDQLKTFAHGIEKATERLESLQKMFRSFVQHRERPQISTLNLREVFKNCIDLFGPLLRKGQVEIQIEDRSQDPNIETMVGVIDRVLLNLIQNAVNALEASPQKQLFLVLQERIDDHISIQVKDTGPGIAPERLHSLWQKFGHSETAQKKKEAAESSMSRVGGSGFGLYKAKQMVEELQGEIRVLESTAKGTIFEIILPRKMNPARLVQKKVL